MTTAYDVALRPSHGPAEWPELVRIWRSVAQATHDFLMLADIDFYESRLANEYLKLVDVTVAESGGIPVGFSGVADGNLEMLFVDQQNPRPSASTSTMATS